MDLPEDFEYTFVESLYLGWSEMTKQCWISVDKQEWIEIKEKDIDSLDTDRYL